MRRGMWSGQVGCRRAAADSQQRPWDQQLQRRETPGSWRRSGDVGADRTSSDWVPPPGVQRDRGADAEAFQSGKPDIPNIIESWTLRQMGAAPQ